MFCGSGARGLVVSPTRRCKQSEHFVMVISRRTRPDADRDSSQRTQSCGYLHFSRAMSVRSFVPLSRIARLNSHVKFTPSQSLVRSLQISGYHVTTGRIVFLFLLRWQLSDRLMTKSVIAQLPIQNIFQSLISSFER